MRMKGNNMNKKFIKINGKKEKVFYVFPTKKISRKCSECGKRFSQLITDYGSKKLTTDDYDEYCEACNQKAMR